MKEHVESSLSSWRQRARDTAHRAGIPRFWRWWSAEMAALTPAKSRGAVQRRRMRPVVEFGEGVATIWSPAVTEGQLSLRSIANVTLSADAVVTASEGSVAIAQLPRTS